MSEMSDDHERAAASKARHSTQEGSSAKQVHPSVDMLLHMQRTAGNAAVNALLNGRSGRGTAVWRQAAKEDESPQAMGPAQFEAVQRHHHHIPAQTDGHEQVDTAEESDDRGSTTWPTMGRAGWGCGVQDVMLNCEMRSSRM